MVSLLKCNVKTHHDERSFELLKIGETENTPPETPGPKTDVRIFAQTENIGIENMGPKRTGPKRRTVMSDYAIDD